MLPQLDRALIDGEPGRTLLAGSPRLDLAEKLAAAGHWVTVADLEEDAAAQWHARMAPAVAARLTLACRTYGDVAFGPASFDRILLSDALFRYKEPQWVIAKAQRELKPDALLFVREPVAAPVPTAGSASAKARTAAKGLQAIRRAALSPLHPWFVGAQAAEAIDRGAHLHLERFALQHAAVSQALAAALTVDQQWLGHPLRLLCGELAFGARPRLAAMLATLARALPENDDPALPGLRAAGFVARRALKGGVTFG